MTSKTHVALGMLCGVLAVKYFPNNDTYITITATCIGSLIPDLDTRKSDPSQIFPIVSTIVDKFTKHRGFTHTMFPLLLIITYFMSGYYPVLMLGIGSLSHTIIDAVTLSLKIKCNSNGEHIIYNLLWAVNIAFILNVLAEYYKI